MDRLAVAAYPDIDSLMSESDRWVDLVEEGVDCALRYGALRDSELGRSRSAWLAPDRRHGRSSSTAVEPPPLFSFRKHSG